MKKCILSLFTVCILIMTSLFSVFAAENKLGDVDGNGTITAADARLALRSSVKLENLSIFQMLAADVNKDGYVSAADARTILRASVGLENLNNTSSQNIIFATGGTTGTYYAFSSAITSAIDITPEINIFSSGGSIANITGINNNDYQMAIAENSVMNYAYLGINEFNAPIKSFSAIACTYEEVCHIVTTKNSGIRSVYDLKGKNVAVSSPESSNFYDAVQILAAAGLDYRTDIKALYSSFGDAATALRDGSIDAAFITAGAPTASITELSMYKDIIFVSIPDNVINNLINSYPFYTKYTITNADYSFVRTPVQTVADKATIIAADSLSEEFVYNFTKELWEDPDIPGCHAKASKLDIRTALEGLGNVPLHPGALKYYKEKGIISSDSGDLSDVKIGVICLHDENSTYDLNFIQAVNDVKKSLGLRDNQVHIVTNIPESKDCYEMAVDLAEDGYDIIFANSFGHEDFMIRAAKEYPDVQFCHATGIKAHTENLSNYHNAYAAVYEGRYLTGIAAGLKLNEMIKQGKITKNSAKIGYIGAFPYSEVISGYTAFYLGAKSVCPTVTMDVKFINSWYDIALERETARALIKGGCVLISQHSDSMGAPIECETENVPNISYNYSSTMVCPNTAILSCQINWRPYFEYIIRSEAEGKKIATDWCGDLSTGSVVLTEINNNVAADGTQKAINEAKAKLINGNLKVFDTSTFTVNGEILTSYIADVNYDDAFTHDTEVISDGCFHECKHRSYPYFDILIDNINVLN